MNEEESLKEEKEVLRHFENLKAGLLKALRTGVFQNFDETAQIKISITVIENYIEQSFVGVAFDK
jgi:hypothetical protein